MKLYRKEKTVNSSERATKVDITELYGKINYFNENKLTIETKKKYCNLYSIRN